MRIPIAILLLLFSSCATIMIRQNIVTREDDWLMANSDIYKSNTSKSVETLSPPFQKVWDYNVDAGFSNNVLSLSDAILFSSNLRGEVYAIDVSTGKRLGHISKFGGSFYGVPLIDGKNIIFTIDGNKRYSVVSYNVSKGETNWEFNAGFIRSSPIMVNGLVYTANKSGKIFCIDPSKGNPVWEVNTGAGSSFFTSPASDGKNIYIGNTSGKLFAIDASDGSPVWDIQFENSFYSDVSIRDTKLFTGNDDGYFRAITTSGNIVWEKELGTKTLSSSTFFEGKVISAGIDGRVFALDEVFGDVVWEFQTNGSISASPVLSGDLIFIGSFDRNFYCLNASNGELLWQYQTEGRIKATALVWKGFIFAASDDRKIYCFR